MTRKAIRCRRRTWRGLRAVLCRTGSRLWSCGDRRDEGGRMPLWARIKAAAPWVLLLGAIVVYLALLLLCLATL